MSAPPRRFRLITVGDSGVGKSSIAARYFDPTYRGRQQPTIGVEYMPTRPWYKDGHYISVSCVDTSGMERFSVLTTSQYRGVHGVLVVYDITSAQSFRSVERWLREVRENERAEDRPYTRFMLVGNKTDLGDQRVVSREEAITFAGAHKMLPAETSARDGRGIDDAFSALLEAIYVAHQRRGPSEPDVPPEPKFQSIDIFEGVTHTVDRAPPSRPPCSC